MSVSATWALRLNVRETLVTDVDAASNPIINHTGFSSGDTINASSTVPATEVSADTWALSGGAVTIDLTSLPGTNGTTIDATGLKVQLFKVKNLGAAAMTFTEGASNGYALLGASFQFILAQNQELMLYLVDSAPDVGSTDKTIDVAGTSSQTFELILVVG